MSIPENREIVVSLFSGTTVPRFRDNKLFSAIFGIVKKWIFLFVFTLGSLVFHAQDSIPIKNGIDKPNTTTAHHFGLFHLRINQNFREKAIQQTELRLSLESANSMHPFVEAYLPQDPAIRQQFRQLSFFDRRFDFIDQQTTPAEYMNIQVDAVFKAFRLDLITKLNNKSDLSITLRTFMPTEGNYPFTLFTNDQTIEWFHSNIAGGEDPFGRRFFGTNQVNVSYQDRNGRQMNLSKNQFIFGGLEVSHHYYPNFFAEEKNIYVNLGSHLGVNFSEFNQSVDLGVSANIHKKWQLQNKNELRLGMGLASLRKGMINFQENVDFGNNVFLGSGELSFEFTKYTQKGNYHSFSFNYQFQTRYNKLEETEYYFLDGGTTWQDIHQGWHNGFSTLYESLTVYSLIYGYQRKNFGLSLYVQQDFKLNNAPDLQTGIQLRIPLTRQ